MNSTDTKENQWEAKEIAAVASDRPTLTISDNLIELSDDNFIRADNHVVKENINLTSSVQNDMIDLNFNKSTSTELMKSKICESSNKKIISDLGTILFESILEPLLYPNNTFPENDFSCFGENVQNAQIVNDEQLDNRNIFKNEENFNCSTNSLVSENLSSPMQTSTDNMIDSELASNDSQSPRTLQRINNNTNKQSKKQLNYGHSLLEIKKFNEFCSGIEKSRMYSSNESLSNPKSDQSLLNSDESCDSSPVHKFNKDYVMRKTTKKHKSKKNFGVKTLQAIFGNKNDGYSDISSTNSDCGDEYYLERTQKHSISKPIKTDLESIELKRVLNPTEKPTESQESKDELEHIEKQEDELTNTLNEELSRLLSKPIFTEISPQFEKNIHTFLSETFDKKSRQNNKEAALPNFAVSNKKYFMLHGQSLRVGKALRLCPNEEALNKQSEPSAADHKLSQRDKLLARYVYNSHSINVDGVGDPDFGTPV